jgi:regulator of sigma E protease
MTFASTIVAFIVALGVLVAFHEYGHYLAARLCGVKVLRFCIGFGRPVWMRRFGRDGTEWALAAFPLGGYVKLLGHDSEDAVPEAEAHRAFNAQPVGKRMFIIAAGPLANFLLAITLYWGLNVHGVEELPPTMAAPAAQSPAALAGLVSGDTVTRVGEHAIASWSDLNWRMLQALEARATVSLETRAASGHIAFPRLDLSRLDGGFDPDQDALKRLGFTPFRPSPRVVGLEPDAPAARAGLREQDVLLQIDGNPVAGADAFVAAMRASPGRERRLLVRRDGVSLEIAVTPQAIQSGGVAVGRIGARISDRMDPVRVRYGAVDALSKAAAQTWETSAFSLRMLWRMLQGEVSWRNLSGPVTIADYAGKTARLGLEYYLGFIALVSISLGVLNLLPVPLLDGGHLLYYFIEILRGKPVPASVMEIGTRVGLALVVTTMVLALYNDIHRLFAG